MTIFVTLQVLVAVCCFLLAGIILVHGHQLAMTAKAFRIHRRLMMWFLVALAANSLSSAFIVRGDALEVYATQPLTLLYVSFAVLTMWGSLCFDRRHHVQLSAWVLMLQIPAVLLVVNALMLGSGNYRQLMNTADLLVYHADAPIVFAGRLLFMALILVFWLMALGMLIEAWLHSRKSVKPKQSLNNVAPSASSHLSPLSLGEAVGMEYLLGYWAFVLILAIVPFCQNSAVPHFIKNTLFIIGLLLTARVYVQQVRFTRERLDGSITGRLVSERLHHVLALEQGGTTPWGSYMPQNPFYCKGNPELDDVASALSIPRDELSQYVHQTLKTNLVAWVSEQRLRHCAEAIALADRKITEIAAATGYNDVPTFTRAFKRQYGVAPSEYRKKEKDS